MATFPPVKTSPVNTPARPTTTPFYRVLWVQVLVAMALAIACRPSPEIASSSQPHPQNERRRSRSVTSVKPIVLAVNNGYLYDLFRKFGLSDFGARTGSFVLERPSSR